jgi:hypothetical protein
VALLPAGSIIVLGADDTIERRRGKKLTGIGCYRDGVRSSKKQVIKCFGLKWLSLMVMVKLPWSRRVWALPFLSVLCRAKAKNSQREHKRQRILYSIDILMICARLVRWWLPQHLRVLVADGAFAAVKLALICADAPQQRLFLVTRLRLDAKLF